MRKLTGKQVRFLRGEGHHLKPILQVGKSGISESFIKEALESFEAHELIKIKLGKSTEVDLSKAKEEIVQKAKCHLIQSLGKTLLLYRERKEKPSIHLPQD